MADVKIHPDAKRLAQGAAEHVTRLAEEAIAARGQFAVALAGGSTPRGMYERLAVEFAARGEALETRLSPRFDLVLLGMGDDGHTASLFPYTKSMHTAHWVAGHYVHKLAAWRITLTPAALNAAANVIFLVSGAGKAERLRQVITGPYQPDILPAQLIRPTDGHLLWMVDTEAASLL